MATTNTAMEGAQTQDFFGRLLQIGGTIVDKGLNVLDHLDRREYNKDIEDIKNSLNQEKEEANPNTQVSTNTDQTTAALLAAQIKGQMTTRNVLYGAGALIVGLIAAKAFKII